MRSFAWQSQSSDLGRFTRPLDVTLDVNDNIYTVEASLNRVQKFDREGSPLNSWPLSPAIANPESTPVHIHATGSPARILVSTGAELQLFDAGGSVIVPNPFALGDIVAPGPISETVNGELILTDTDGAGTEFFVVSQSGTVVAGRWVAPNCNATDVATGQNNLIYALCEPGVTAREIRRRPDALRAKRRAQRERSFARRLAAFSRA